MAFEEEGPRQIGGSAIEIAVWRGEVNADLRTLKGFTKDIDHNLAELGVKVDLKTDALTEKISDLKYSVSKFVIWGGVGMFFLNIIIVVAAGVLIKWLTKGM
jgi:hypothetical protein